MQDTAPRPKITVSSDAKGIVSQAGALLLAESLRSHRTGRGHGGWAGPVAGAAGGA